MSSASLLQLLATQARLSDGELAERLDMTEEAVRAQREQWEKEGVILGYQAVVNEEYEHDSKVAAFIEVKMTPERDGGFDRLAMRISRFDEVSSCYLASGGFDLLVLVEGMFLYSYTRSYYNGVQQTMVRRFSSITGQLKMYTGDTAQKASASRSVALRRMVEQFSDKDKYEFMLRTKYRPDITVNTRIASTMTPLTAMAFLSCRVTSVILVTSRMAATSSAA